MRSGQNYVRLRAKEPKEKNGNKAQTLLFKRMVDKPPINI
jgi:hypothetical protein